MTIWKFFDKLEDKVRGWFSRHPMLYGVYGGIGTVLFWRGVWHTTDYVAHLIYNGDAPVESTIDLYGLPIWDGFLSFFIGLGILLSCGLFVSEFIGNEIIISGLRGEKKLTEKTEVEVRTETGAIAVAIDKLEKIEKRLEAIEKAKK